MDVNSNSTTYDKDGTQLTDYIESAYDYNGDGIVDDGYSYLSLETYGKFDQGVSRMSHYDYGFDGIDFSDFTFYEYTVNGNLAGIRYVADWNGDGVPDYLASESTVYSSPRRLHLPN